MTAESAGAGVNPGPDGPANIATTPPQRSHFWFEGTMPSEGNFGAAGTAIPLALKSARWHAAQRCAR
jgi:hypothetical protein